VYKKSKEDSIDLVKKSNFLQYNDSNEIVSYIESGINSIYIYEHSPEENILQSILSIQKENIKFNRYYKRRDGKWVFAIENNQKEFEVKLNELKIKLYQLTKSSIINTIIYNKESSNLKAKRKGSDYSNNNNWRKYSNHSGSKKNSFDSYKSNNSYNSGYNNYNNNYNKNYRKKYKRERFNSEGNSNWGYKTFNYGFRNQSEEIEIDISKIKYSLNITNKYQLETVIQVYNKMNEKKKFDNKPNFIVEEEIIGDKPKEIVIFKSLNEKKTFKKDGITNNNQNFFGMKLPKINPLCNMSKNYNKFDMIPQNINLGKE
jgi:hypothetical protein